MKNVVVLCLALSCLVASACMAPLAGSGSASLELRLSGPGLSFTDASSKAFIPGVSQAVRLHATDAEGKTVAAMTVTMRDNMATFTGLPAFEELWLSISTLDGSGNSITSWDGSEPYILTPGGNQITATLAPPTISASLTLYSINNTMNSNQTLVPGQATFYEVTTYMGSVSTGTAVQLSAETEKARWLWLMAYDESWAPLPVLCADQAQGWVVVSWPASGRVYLAVANNRSSPGYPDGTITYAVAARQAYFITPDGSGDSSGSSPTNTISYGDFFGTDRSGTSGFITGGTFSLMQSTQIGFSLRLYGGFSSDFSSRSQTTRLQGPVGNIWTINLLANVILDRLSIYAPEIQYSNTYTGLLVNSGTSIISNCILSGPTLEVGINDQSLYTQGLGMQSGTLEVASSHLTGGYANNSGSFDAETRALSIVNTDPSTTYLHNCTLDGGIAKATGTTNTGSARSYGIYLGTGGSYASLYAAGNRIWGGVADSATADAYSYGVGIQNAAACIITNSAISGGHASGGNVATSSKTYATAVENSASSTIVFSCILDTGRIAPKVIAESSASSIAVAVRALNTITNSMRFDNNIMVSSSPMSWLDQDVCRAALTETSNNQYSFINNSILEMAPFINAYPDVDDDFINCAGTYTGYDIRRDLSPTSVLEAFKPTSTYAEFLANKWKPRNASIFFAGGSAQASGITGAQITSYPAIGLDLGGKPRPDIASTWARGAYNP